MMIMRLYRQIDKKEFSFDFLTCGGDQKYYYEEEIQSLGGHIYRVPKRSVSFIKHHTEMIKLLKNSDYDVIHFHSTHSLFTALELLTVRLAGKRNIVVHSHNTSDLRVKNTGFVWKLAQKYLKTAPVCLSCSKAAAEWLYGTTKGIDIFPLPVTCSNFQYHEEKRMELRKKMGLEDAIIISHVGRFSEQKNHPFLMEIVKEAVALNSNVYAFLMGDGPLKEEMEKKAREEGIQDHIIFWGNDQEVYNKLNASDVFVLPSLFEGLPTVVLEAQASGLPCLVADTVTDEIQETELVKMKSLEDGAKKWAIQLLEMAQNFTGNRIQYNEEIAQKYDIEQVTKTLADIYRK